MAEREFTVNGKRVVLRQSFKAKEYHALPRAWSKQLRLAPGDEMAPLADVVAGLGPFVESWEFEGDPLSVDAWGEMDSFKEFVEMRNAINEYANELLSAGPKN